MSFAAVPAEWSEWRGALRRIANSVNSLGDGRSNAVGSVTLAESTTTTVVTDPRVGTDSVISLMPTTANAAAEAPHIAVDAGTFTITHANAATTDRTFSYAVQG